MAQTCKACGKPFNLGFLFDSGSVCILCADGKKELSFLTNEENEYVRQYYEQGAEHAAYMATPQSLASRLMKSFTLFLIYSVIAAVVVFGAWLINPIIGYLVLGLGIFIEVFFILKWLSGLNAVMEVNDTSNLPLHLTLSFFIPIYGIILTFTERGKIMQKPDGEIRYGRLRIV